jgi:murein DD-endopeptidase / murein LD-carboxypeptidase
MKTGFYTAIICFSVLIFANACRHKKSVVSKPKHKKTEVVKTTTGTGEKSAEPTAGHTTETSAMLVQKLGVSEKEFKSNKLFLFINDWYGVPYKYGGCQKTGVDCSCFTNLLYETVYNKKTGRSADDMYHACEKILLHEAKEGDLIFFRIGGNSVSHVGVYLRNNLFVHSSTSKGVVINSMDEAYYKKYFHSGGRLKNS